MRPGHGQRIPRHSTKIFKTSSNSSQNCIILKFCAFFFWQNLTSIHLPFRLFSRKKHCRCYSLKHVLVDKTCWVKEVKAFSPFVSKVPETVMLLSFISEGKVFYEKPVEIDPPAAAKYVQKGRGLCTVFPPHSVFCVRVLVSVCKNISIKYPKYLLMTLGSYFSNRPFHNLGIAKIG